MKLLLTGANGFVGQYVQAALPCVPLPDGLDLRDRAALTAAVIAIQPDTVLHLAAQSFVPAAFENPPVKRMRSRNRVQAVDLSRQFGHYSGDLLYHALPRKRQVSC